MAEEYGPTKVAALAFHVADGFSTGETWARWYYYNLTYTPTFMFDGYDQYIGNSYYTVKSRVDNHLLNPSPVSIDLWGNIGEESGEVTVDITALYNVSQQNLKCRLILHESRIQYSSRILDHVVRDVLPEESISLSQPGDHVQFQRTLTILPQWDSQYMGLVALVQSDVDKRVLQAQNLADATVSLTPDALSFPRGSTLGYGAALISNVDHPQTVVARAEVWLPNGNPFPGNPVAGPVNVSLTAFQQKTVHPGHAIPMGAPLGSYIYKVTLETLGGQAIDTDEFVFEVTP